MEGNTIPIMVKAQKQSGVMRCQDSSPLVRSCPRFSDDKAKAGLVERLYPAIVLCTGTAPSWVRLLQVRTLALISSQGRRPTPPPPTPTTPPGQAPWCRSHAHERMPSGAVARCVDMRSSSHNGGLLVLQPGHSIAVNPNHPNTTNL